MVDQRLKQSRDPEGDLSRLASVNPLHRLGTPEEIATLATHLLSDESRWTTGAVIPIDGGATAVF
jgi:NAD(P)-dependent dehydrogenase (short-subunit alcohol dehydrogenase family)